MATVRRAFATRPCLPMILPTSSGSTLTSNVTELPSSRSSHHDRVRVVHKGLYQDFDQVLQVRSAPDLEPSLRLPAASALASAAGSSARPRQLRALGSAASSTRRSFLGGLFGLRLLGALRLLLPRRAPLPGLPRPAQLRRRRLTTGALRRPELPLQPAAAGASSAAASFALPFFLGSAGGLLGHAAQQSLDLEQASGGVARLRALADPLLRLLGVQLEHRRLGGRVVVADDLYEPPVASDMRLSATTIL